MGEGPRLLWRAENRVGRATFLQALATVPEQELAAAPADVRANILLQASGGTFFFHQMGHCEQDQYANNVPSSQRGRAFDVFPEYHREAEEALSRAVKLSPDFADAWAALGHVFWKVRAWALVFSIQGAVTSLRISVALILLARPQLRAEGRPGRGAKLPLVGAGRRPAPHRAAAAVHAQGRAPGGRGGRE